MHNLPHQFQFPASRVTHAWAPGRRAAVADNNGCFPLSAHAKRQGRCWPAARHAAPAPRRLAHPLSFAKDVGPPPARPCCGLRN